MGGARLLGRDREIGSLEAGKLADIALWRLDTLAHAGIADPVAALVLGPRPPLDRAPGQRPADRRAGLLLTADERQLAENSRRAAAVLARGF